MPEFYWVVVPTSFPWTIDEPHSDCDPLMRPLQLMDTPGTKAPGTKKSPAEAGLFQQDGLA
jgi:hypothetical protein